MSFGSVQKDLLLSCSWDGTIKLWNPHTSPASLSTWREHTGSVYAVSFAPASPSVFATSGGDRCLKAWDIRSQRYDFNLVPRA